MNKTILKITLCVVVHMMATVSTYAQQGKMIQPSKASLDMNFLEAKIKRITNHQNDFLDFVNPINGGFEGREQTLELFHAAFRFSEILDSVVNLLFIYNKLSCQSDKAIVASLANMLILQCAEKIESEITSINNGLSSIKKTAIVLSGTQFKEDLREIKDRLETIKLK